MPNSAGVTRQLAQNASVKGIDRIERGHPHEGFIHKLLDLPRKDVHSIARVVMAVWAFEDEAKQIVKKRPARRQRNVATK